VGFELRTSQYAVKLKSTFFEAFASLASSGLLAKLVDRNSYSNPPIAGRAQFGCTKWGGLTASSHPISTVPSHGITAIATTPGSNTI